jgi:hypothetical protein
LSVKRALAAALLAGLLAVPLSVAVFLRRPQLFLTDSVAAAAIRLLASADGPRWSSLSFTARSLGGGRHRYALSARDACFFDHARALSGCFGRVELGVLASYSRSGARLERVERLRLLDGVLRLDLTRRTAPSGGAAALPAALSAARWDGARVELSSLTVVDSSGTTTGAFRAALHPGRARPLTVSADFLRRTAAGASRWRGEASARTDYLIAAEPGFLDGEAELSWTAGAARVRAVLKRDAVGESILDLKATATQGGRSLSSGWRMRTRGGRVDVAGGLTLNATAGPLRRAELSACRADAALRPGSVLPRDARLTCRYHIAPSPKLRLPGGAAAVVGTLTADARFDGASGPFRARASATVEPLSDWYSVTGRLALEASGLLGAPPARWAISHAASAEIAVPRFEDLVAFLLNTPYSVPAPFHVLHGPLTLSVRTSGDPRASVQTASYRLSSDLSGRRQRLRAEMTGVVTATSAWTRDRTVSNRGELVLQEAAVELPRADVASLPKVTVDRRVKLADAAPGAAKGKANAVARPVSQFIRVRTEKPLVLFSNLAREPVPVALDLTASAPPGAVGGTIAVRRFDLEIFRRTAVLDHLNVTLKPGETSGTLDGLILYTAPSAVIRILLLGTTDRPRVELSSVPPLRPEDIIAVLIFGKSPAELDLDQTASVGNAQNALEGSAFGLATLYYFGVTPIERVGYDPASKSYSVKLRLPGGVSAELGSDFDKSRGLMLRKFLAPHWAVESEIGNQSVQGTPGAAGAAAGAATAFLEWFKRY